MKTSQLTCILNLAGIVMLTCNFTVVKVQAGGNMMDYYLPMPMYQNRLESTGVWGVKNVVPRDIYNGLEDSSCKKYAYWDGKIIKGKDSKYHMYCSRWDQSAGHNGAWGATAVHAVSDSIMGPYIDKGLLYTSWNGGKGHNVTALTLPDGRVAIVVCENVPLTIYTADDPNGPYTMLGSVKIDKNGHNTGDVNLESNWSICMRDDGSFLAVCRDGFVMLSTNGILGPYLVQTDRLWPPTLAGYNTSTWEDPVIWHSGKKYYCTVNAWASKKAIYMTSDDGISNWKYGGEAYSPLNQNILRYTNGRKNIWCKMERPNVYVENNILKYLTFAVIDTEKEADFGNDNHNSKIIVVPFDGAMFDSDTLNVTFYPDNDYAGTSVTLKPGNYTKAQLSAAGIPDNSVSSIKMSSGLSVEIYSGDNFTGTKWTLKSDCTNLGPAGCNDSMSSVKIGKFQDSTTYTVKKSPHIVSNTIMIPGLGTFKVDNAPDFQVVQFTNLLGKKVLAMPVESGKAIERCNLPYGSYIMNFYGKERIRSRSYKVLIK